MATCPSCGRNVVVDAAFCGYCGTRIAAEPADVYASAPQRPASEYWVCHACHSENLVVDAFCQNCGAAKESAALAGSVAVGAGSVGPRSTGASAAAVTGPSCSVCGAANEADARFCFACGVPLDGLVAGAGAPAGPAPAGRSSRWLILAVVIIAIAAVAAVAAIVLLRDDGSDGGSSGAGSSSSSGTVVAQSGSDTTTPDSDTTTSTSAPTESDVTGYVSNARASSCLPPDDGIAYNAWNLIDGNMRTCWAEGVKGSFGVGETVRFKFSPRMTLTRMQVMPGYKKYADGWDRWYSNARLKKITISYADGTQETFPLSDRKAWQNCFFSSEKTGSSLEFTIDAVYYPDRGPHYAEDTSVSEIRFFGWPASEGSQ